MQRFLFALVLFVGAAACGTSNVPAESPAPAQQSAQPATPASLETATPAEDAAKKQRLEMAESTRKQVAEAFAFTYGWKDAVMGTDGGPICQLRERNDDLRYAMSVMTGRPGLLKPTWIEVGIGKEEAEKKVRDIAIEYAKELNRILDLPDDTRRAMGSCSAGEGEMALVNASHLTAEIVDALESFNGNPGDIGTTPEKLRGRLLAYFLREISAGRAEMKKTGSSFRLSKALNDATYLWNFTSDQLKVTEEELRLTREG